MVTKREKYPVVIALDQGWEESKDWIPRLSKEVWGFKVGSILFCERGPAVIKEILNAGADVFLDLKYHDIPNTVEHAVKEAVHLGVKLVTIHASGGRAMLSAAAKHQKGDVSLLAVTVLTSLDQADLRELAIDGSLAVHVERLAKLAVDSGVRGLVCSPSEVSRLRELFPDAKLVVPGIRIADSSDDQKRTADIKTTLSAGASLLVIGRALTAAKDWEVVWQKMKSSMDEISSKKP